MRPFFRTLALVALAAAVLVATPACMRQRSDTAKKFHLEVAEKTNSFAAQEAAEHAKKPAPPASTETPKKLVEEKK